MSEERNDMPPRRRRYRNPEPADIPADVPADIPADVRPEAPVSGEQPGGARPAQTQGPYSRVPEEARRMSASPYGAVNAAAAQRAAESRAAFRKQKTSTHPIRPIRERAVRDAGRNASEEPMSRVRVGYAPGRMSESGLNREGAEMRSGVREYPNPRYPANLRSPYARPMPENARPVSHYPAQEAAPEEPRRKKGTVLHILTAVLIAAGVFLAVVLMLPKDSGLRQGLSELAGKATAGIRAAADTESATRTEQPEGSGGKEAAPTADQFSSTDSLEMLQGNTGTAAERAENVPETPADSGPAGEPAEADEIPVNAADDRKAEAVLPEEKGAQEGVLSMESFAPMNAEQTPETTENAEAADDAAQAAENVEIADDAEPAPEDAELTDDMEPEAETADDLPAETEPDGETNEDAEAGGEDEAEEEEPAPVTLTAEAVPAADPQLIKTVTLYNGQKSVKEYTRPAKDLIRMPSGWDYTRQQIGVLTFRGNAFRTNGAVGRVDNARGLTQVWEAESGSARGASQTYYGTGWPGQPAIVKWSTQIRQGSNLYEKFTSKEGLKEVIVAGLDGVVRFMDLETGALTRNGIKLGYPMRGTPSLHPSGYPYMSVGQFARKMKSGTGKIGLRQYNMYTEDEIKLINGVDKSYKPFSTTGSFETSALIDRISDTAVVAGTNGLLYLIDLNSELDWQAGIYKSKQTTAVLKTKANGEKNNLTAVESSPAMYDRYVYYADMGGILRCVDTDFLKVIWAVDTKDAVMASVALDQRDPESLDLYTANMLKNRKSGSAQIRRYNALSGKELWCTEIGVKKDTKNKTDSGCKASPVIGENSLDGLVYFTVTGLSNDGRSTLNLPEETKAALVALDKETGRIAWSYGLSDRSESSPIAVYDEDGNGWIIQCAWDGSIVMLDGLSGETVATAKAEGNIEASPAAYNDMMVIGTTGKGTERIYGFRIGEPEEGEGAE